MNTLQASRPQSRNSTLLILAVFSLLALLIMRKQCYYRLSSLGCECIFVCLTIGTLEGCMSHAGIEEFVLLLEMRRLKHAILQLLLAT
jgi:hypothetical protein